MIRFGVVTNPGSLRNRSDPSVRRVLERHPEVPRVVFTGSEDLRSGMAWFASQGVTDLVIDGGDGTVVAAIGAAIGAREFLRPPRFAVIPSGTTNLIAAQVGNSGPRAEVIERLLALSPETAAARSVQCPPFRVERAGFPILHGFLIGAAAFHRGTLLSLRDMDRFGFAQKAVAGLIIANLWRVLVGADRPAFLAGDAVSTEVDGIALPGDRRFLFLATTLDRLALRLRPFWGEGPGAIRWLDITSPPERLPTALPRVLLGRPAAWMAQAGYRSGRATTVTLRTRRPLVLDGEIIEPGIDGTIGVRTAEPQGFIRLT